MPTLRPPAHGDVRCIGDRIKVYGSPDGLSAKVVTRSETFCVQCGWIQTDGVMGPLCWMAQHTDHQDHQAES